MNIKRVMLMIGLAVVVAALAVPLVGFKTRAAGAAANARAPLAATKAPATAEASVTATTQPKVVEAADSSQESAGGENSSGTPQAPGDCRPQTPAGRAGNPQLLGKERPSGKYRRRGKQ